MLGAFACNNERTTVSRTAAVSSAHASKGVAGIILGLFLVGVIAISPAQADSYRYWSYLLGQDNEWAMAQTGPGDRVLLDRDVDGWQFGIFGVEGGATPKEAPDFAALCPELEAAGPTQGQVRVAVVIDSGTAQEAPAGETPIPDSVTCTSIAAGSNGYQALASAATVRTDSGLVCGIDGYPATECAAVVPDSAPTTSTDDVITEEGDDAAQEDPVGSAGTSSVWLWLAIAVAVAVLAVIALRRRQNPQP
jgi:hypothetical protein